MVLTAFHYRSGLPEDNMIVLRSIPNLLESYVPKNAIYKALRYIFLPATTFLSTLFLVLRYRPRILHVHSSTAITPGACLFSMLFRIPIIIDVQDLFPERFPLNRVIRTGCSPRYIALGKNVEQMLISINIPRKNILTLPLARFPIERNILGIPERNGVNKNIIFLFIGELTEIKGIDILLEAFKLASDRSVNLFLNVIGDGPMLPYCEMFIMKNKLNIKMSGRLNHNETLREIALSDVVILPSRIESFGRVIIEAFEFEKAVIASRVGGIPQLIKEGENGIMVGPCDPKGLADAMIRLEKDEVLREKLGKNGKRSLEDLPSFEEIAGKILEFYKKI